MSKTTKIIAIILCCLVAACCVAIGVGTVLNDDTTRATDSTENSETTATNDVTKEPTVSSTQNKEDELKNAIIGKWRDSADMSGFEFFDDGTVEITYVNLTVPVINIPVNGTTKGTYTISGDTLTTKFSIYSATIDDTYKVSVNGNELSLTDLEDFETATYMRVKASSETETTKEPGSTTATTKKDESEVLYDDELIGSWENSSGKKYKFSDDGTVKITSSGSSYSGIYITDSGNLTVQYVSDGKKVTEKYTYTVSKNSLSLKNKSGAESLFIREGTGSAGVSEDDLLGVWRDSADMSGFEFKQDGLVEITYVNFTVPVVNIPINGTFVGSYTVKNGLLTVTSSIYGSTNTDTYEYKINGNSLTLKNIENGDTLSYVKQ